jgi:hypothetical protein
MLNNPAPPAAVRPARKERRVWMICIRTLLFRLAKAILAGTEQKRFRQRQMVW